MPSCAAMAPIAQHRGGDAQLACDLDQRPTAARQQGDRLPLELIRKVTPFLAHSTPSRSCRSLAKVSTNAGEAHLAEYGHVVPQGPAHVGGLVALVEDPKSSVPESARGILQVLIRTLNALEEQLKELDGEIARRAKADPVARRL